jgi:hypothetical protein
VRDYARVAPAFWTKGSGKGLRGNPDAQLVGLYLVTCPSSNMIGLYYLPLATAAHETGLKPETLRKALRSIQTAGFAYYDEVSEYVWVPNAATYQIGEFLAPGDKRQKGVLRELQPFASHPFAQRFFDKYAGPYGLSRPLWLGEIPETEHKPLACQDQEQAQAHAQEQAQEQEQDQEARKGSSAGTQTALVLVASEAAKRSAPPLASVHEVFVHWVKHWRLHHPKGPEPRLDDKRAGYIRDRLREGFDVETLKLAVEGVWRDRWHLGENDRNEPYTDVRHALKDAAKVERLAELAQKARDLVRRKLAAEAPTQPPEAASGTVAVAPEAPTEPKPTAEAG